MEELLLLLLSYYIIYSYIFSHLFIYNIRKKTARVRSHREQVFSQQQLLHAFTTTQHKTTTFKIFLYSHMHFAISEKPKLDSSKTGTCRTTTKRNSGTGLNTR